MQDAQRELLQRILASPHFSRSPRLTEFLLYVCERSLEGRAAEISEQQIGINVFKRPPSYHPNDDSIVRSHARLLRQKLDAYFEEEGRAEEIRLSIPKGRYVPCFETLPVAPALAEPMQAKRRNYARSRLWAMSALLVLGIAAAFAARYFGPVQNSHSVTGVFWSTFFSSGAKVLIVPADSALALVEDVTHKQINLTDYLDHRYHFDLTNVPGWNQVTLNRLAGHHYTSMADLNLTARLVRLPAATTHPVEIRYARDLKLADLKEGSAILIGGPRANPWEELFQDRMNFTVDTDTRTLQNRISNKAPVPGEQKTYGEPQGDSPARAYGLVALLPGLRASTRTLVVEGTSSAGTECAADFLLDDTTLGNFINKISKGRTNPYFEVVLQSNQVAGSAPQPQIVASRLIGQ